MGYSSLESLSWQLRETYPCLALESKKALPQHAVQHKSKEQEPSTPASPTSQPYTFNPGTINLILILIIAIIVPIANIKIILLIIMVLIIVVVIKK